MCCRRLVDCWAIGPAVIICAIPAGVGSGSLLISASGMLLLPSLKTVRGEQPGEIHRITGSRTVLGRNPKCEVVLDNIAVSRQHAQILETQGRYLLEDLRSRNQTFLNGQVVEGQVELKDGDRIKICGLVFEFTDERRRATTNSSSFPHAPTRAMEVLEVATGEGSSADILDGDKSSIISTLDVASGSGWRLGVKPEAKLRAVLEMSSALGQVLELEDVLHKLLDGLFNIFPQVDEGFVLLHDPERNKLKVEATKVRRVDVQDTVRISSTIVQQAMETGKAILSADALEDSRFQTSESLTDLRIRSMMCVPLCGKSERPLGVIQISTRDARQQFAKDDLDVLVSVASQATLAVENSRLHSELLKQRDMQRELEFANQVQLGFLPSQCPQVPGLDFFDYYEAAQTVGGDYFDYVKLQDGRVAMALGDVAGKGVAAALLMARLYSATRYHLLTNSSLSGALAGLNGEIASSGLGHRFITFIIALVDQKEHTVTTVNAGHLPLLHRKADGTVITMQRKHSGLPLGIVPEQTFEEITFPFEPGDACLLYTDGITEAMSPDLELYSGERLEQFLRNLKVCSAESIVKGIVADVEQFSRGRAQADDMCMVSVYRHVGD